MGDGHNRDRGDDSHRLDEALKQIHLIRDRLDDDALANDLQDAAELIEHVRKEIS